jgi:DNA-binding CsgD family transcriptional regulator
MRARQRWQDRQRRPEAGGRALGGESADRREARGLSENKACESIVITIEIEEPDLAARLNDLLAGAPYLRLAAPGEQADVTIVLRERIASSDADAGLTPRELEVLTLLTEGASNKTIARQLGISVHTAKFHVGSLIDRLDAAGRTMLWLALRASGSLIFDGLSFVLQVTKPAHLVNAEREMATPFGGVECRLDYRRGLFESIGA